MADADAGSPVQGAEVEIEVEVTGSDPLERSVAGSIGWVLDILLSSVTLAVDLHSADMGL